MAPIAVGITRIQIKAANPHHQAFHRKSFTSAAPVARRRAIMASATKSAGSQLEMPTKDSMSAASEGNIKTGHSKTSGNENIVVDCSIRVDNLKCIQAAELEIWVKDSETGEVSEPTCISQWESKEWDRSATGDGNGAILTGRIPLGPVQSPGAIFVIYNGPESENAEKRAKQLSRVFVADITLEDDAFGKVKFTVRSFINAIHTKLYGARVFFTDKALLPNATPKALINDRKEDLEIIKGEDRIGLSIANKPRMPADRIEDYDVYNDLGSEKAKRPILGGNLAGYSYPRRTKTNRGLNPDGTEIKPIGDRWVPADKDFNETKQDSFASAGKVAALPLITRQLFVASNRLGPVGVVLGWWTSLTLGIYALFRFRNKPTKAVTTGIVGGFWSSFHEVISIYDNIKPTAAIVKEARLGRTNDDGKVVDMSQEEKDEQTRRAINALSSNGKRLILRNANISVSDFDSKEKVVPEGKWKEMRKLVNAKLEWQEPFVLKGQHTKMNKTDYDGTERIDSWATDEEFGRQYKAGMNPFTLTAMKAMPGGSSLLSSNVDLISKHLEGYKLENLIADVNAGSKPRIFLVDYESVMEEFAAKVNALGEDRCLYAGCCMLYQRDDTSLVPVAIELYAPGTQASGRVLYTPSDPAQVWLLAKAAINNVDGGIHQLVSHWLRTHACVEPYIIATDRNLSQMHPVNKLLQPHLQFTLRINADARSVLISADALVELVFTPGSESMQLSARAYEQWRFSDQAFPNDVVGRGLAKYIKGDSGPVEIIAEDHPWCEDGLLIWNALHNYISDYVAIYYKCSKDVTSDPELNKWWSEIREKGHPDIKTGWPAMTTPAELVHILCTIAWTTSGHHASVNFGQADYGSLHLNRTSLLRKPIPAKGSKAYQALTNPKTFEKEFLRYIANQLPATINITLVEILSTHNLNEHYLSDMMRNLLERKQRLANLQSLLDMKAMVPSNVKDNDQKYIGDEEALAVHARLLRELSDAEETMAKRNTSDSSMARTVSKGGLPYQLLIPSGVDGEGNPLPQTTTEGQRVANKPGRGIPFSISI